MCTSYYWGIAYGRKRGFFLEGKQDLNERQNGRIVTIPLSTSGMTLKGMSPPVDEADVAVDAVKRRLTSTISRKLHEE